MNGVRLLRRGPIGPPLAPSLLVSLGLRGLGLAWEAVVGALGGEPFDAGVALAGILFLAVPVALLATVIACLRRADSPVDQRRRGRIRVPRPSAREPQ